MRSVSRNAPARLRAALLVLLAAAACSDDGPTTPDFLPPTGGGTDGSLSGRLITQHDQAPVPGATLLFAGRTATTDAAGLFQLAGIPSSGSGVVTINVPGHLFRGVAVTLGTRSDLTFDLVRDAPPFSLEFYRAFVRNNFEGTTMLETRPWTRAPSFFLKTTVEGTDDVVPDAVIERIRDVIAKSVHELTGGRFEVAAFETGPEARPAEDGWVTITFFSQLGAVFGRSTVGGNTGTIEMRYGMVSSDFTNPYHCLTPEVALVDHEITHTMGYWHTRDVFVDSFSGEGCPGSGRPAHVAYHASVMYSRPPGNRDPDVDPVESARTHALGRRGAPPMVECTFLPRAR